MCGALSRLGMFPTFRVGGSEVCRVLVLPLKQFGARPRSLHVGTSFSLRHISGAEWIGNRELHGWSQVPSPNNSRGLRLCVSSVSQGWIDPDPLASSVACSFFLGRLPVVCGVPGAAAEALEAEAAARAQAGEAQAAAGGGRADDGLAAARA